MNDQVPPVPVSVELDCTNQTFRLEFSEQVVTSTVQPTDFSILTPSGGTVGVSVVNPDQPSAFAQAGFTLVLSAALLEPGTHTLSVTAVSGNVEDPCGNIVVDTLFQFEVVAPLSIDVTTTTACNGSNGTLLATHSAGGAEPIIFTLAGMPLPSGSATGLDAGPYTLQAEDANGCVITEVVNVPDHVLDVQVPQVQDSLSCAKPSIVIEGVQVVPEQVVQYAWTAVTDAGTDLRGALDQTNYCIWCHVQDKDSCSKGMKEKPGPNGAAPWKRSTFGVNLAGNAVKFTAEGSVQIDLRWTPGEDHTGSLDIAVRDTGVGIPEVLRIVHPLCRDRKAQRQRKCRCGDRPDDHDGPHTDQRSNAVAFTRNVLPCRTLNGWPVMYTRAAPACNGKKLFRVYDPPYAPASPTERSRS